MDQRLGDAIQQQMEASVQRPVWIARLACTLAAMVVLLLACVAWLTGSGWWFAFFIGAFVLLGLSVSVTATALRRRQQKQNQEWLVGLWRLAVRDELSGLYNRRYFSQALDEAVRNSKNSRTPLSLLILDLNDLKLVNDSLGHQAGDRAIAAAASAISGTRGLSGTVARIGGDEFAVIAPGLSQIEAEALRLDLEWSLENASFLPRLPLRACIGLGTLEVGMDADGLFRAADRSLYAAKAKCAAGRTEMPLEKTAQVQQVHH